MPQHTRADARARQNRALQLAEAGLDDDQIAIRLGVARDTVQRMVRIAKARRESNKATMPQQD